MMNKQSATPPIDSIKSAFNRAFEETVTLLDIERLVKGHGHESWIVVTNTEEYLLKISLRTADTQKMRALMETLAIVNANGIPAPRLYAYGQSEDLFGNRPYLIQEYLSGKDAEDAWMDLTHDEKESYFVDFGKAVGKMHTISCKEFREDVSVPSCAASWADVVKTRLDRLVDMNKKAGVLNESEIRRIAVRIDELLLRMNSDISPGLTHRDLYLPNTLVFEGRFRALLDFEHAKFYDPLFDFVKIRMWVFEEYPFYEEHFIRGYLQETVFPSNSEERIKLCLGLELLAGFPYWQRVGQPEMTEDYRERLKRWLT